MSDNPEDPSTQGWAAPTFSPSLNGTVQRLPLNIRCNFPVNRSGKWKVHIYNPGYRREITGTHNGNYYDVAIDELEQGPECEIHAQFDAQGSWSDWAFSGKFFVIKPVHFTVPASNSLVPSRAFLSGAGAYPNANIEVVASPGGRVFTTTGAGDGRWTVAIPGLAAGVYDFVATQTFNKVKSAPSGTWRLTVAQALSITSPVSGAIVIPRPMVAGVGHTGAVVQVLEGQNTSTIYGQTTVQNGSWQVMLSRDLPFRNFEIGAKMLVANEHLEWSTNQVSVKPFLPPTISTPDEDSFQTTIPTVSGIGAPGAEVKIYLDRSIELIGTARVSNQGTWSTSVTKALAIGVCEIVAEQTLQGADSGRSTVRMFKVRPPKQIEVNVEILLNQGARFSGIGHNGATLVLSHVSGPENKQLPEVVVANGVWQVSSTAWTLGAYTYSVIQKVSDNAGGWIPSEDFQFTFTIVQLVPDPVPDRLDAYSYTPTFTGRGTNGALVLIKKQGGAEAAPDASVAGGRWSGQSRQEWGPTLSQNVDLKQRLNGRDSANWIRLVVKIPPLAPVITGLVDNDLSPDISGTCWRSGAVVNLVFSDNPTRVETASVTGGTWTFRRSTPFVPYVTHTVTVTQIAAQQTSPPATRTFEVRRTLHKPVINYPSGESEVERDLSVRGLQGMAGASMQLRVDGINAGSAVTLTSDGSWSIDLKGLAFGRRIIDAQQTLDGRPSERSDPMVVNVLLMPPVFTTPLPGGDLPRVSTISGTGLPGAMVEVWLDGRDDFLFQGVSVNADGRWEGPATLPVGVTKLRARQTIGEEDSRDSPLLTCNVVPAAPFIETPVKDGHVGRLTVVSGFGVPGDTVTILLNAAELGSAPVLSDRTWSVPVSLTQPGGVHVLVAMASYDGFKSDQSAAQPVELGSYVPVIDSPPTGGWVSDPLTFSGQGRPGTGQLVSWFNPELPWAPDLAVSAQGWRGASIRALPVGGNWCRFKQTITDGADASTISDWCESGRFDVFEPPSR